MRSSRRFRCEAASVSAARHFVRDVLREQSREAVEAAELMTSELATNSVRHAHSDFELTIHCSQREIRVEVSDGGQGQPTLRSPTPHERSGRGLRIVAELSDTWGTVPSTNGKMVWFTLPVRTFATEREPRSADCSDEVPGSGAPGAGLPGSAGLREPKGPGGRSSASIDFKPHASGLPAIYRPAIGDLIEECFFIWRAVGIRPTRRERIRGPQLHPNKTISHPCAEVHLRARG
jgi:anti-sigma regulatory factor (Ser/Thr protein kinase)